MYKGMGTVNDTKWFNVVNMGGQNDKDIWRDEVLWEGDVDPQLWFMLSMLRRVAAIGEVMKSDVPSSFYSPTAVVGPRDPDKESLGVFGITKEAGYFATWRKLGQAVRQDTRCTHDPKEVKMR